MEPFVYLRDVVTLELAEELCNGCGFCMEVCPHAVLRPANGRVRIGDRDACMECGACSRNCPTGALTVTTGVGCATAILKSGSSSKPCC